MENTIKERVRSLLESMERVNSEFPATEKFLEMKGLESVHDLTKKEERELIEYLEKCLKEKRRMLLH